MALHEITFPVTTVLRFPDGRSYGDIASVEIDEKINGDEASFSVLVWFRGDAEPHPVIVSHRREFARAAASAITEAALRAQPVPQLQAG